MDLSEQEQSRIVELAVGSGDGPERARERLEELGCDTDLDELMADWNYGMCHGCGWFKPTYEFIDDESEIFEDEACRECNNYNPDEEAGY